MMELVVSCGCKYYSVCVYVTKYMYILQCDEATLAALGDLSYSTTPIV